MKRHNYLSIFLALLGWLAAAGGYSQSLDVLLEEAAENYPGLEASRRQYLAALEKAPQARALPDPELSFGYFISPIETRVGPQLARVGAMQMFPWFGMLARQEEAAAEEAKVKYRDFLSERDRLFFSVKSLWYKLYELDHSARLTRRQLGILDSYESMAVKRFEQGKGGMVDILRVQMEREELENKVLYLEEMKAPVRAGLNRSLGRELLADIRPADSLPESGFGIYREIILDSIGAGNNQLIGLRHAQEAMASRAEAAKKAGSPSFGLGLTYMLTGPRKEVVMEQNGKDALLPMLSVRIPLARNKYRAMVNEMELKQSAVAFTEESKRSELAAEFESVWLEYEDALRRIALYGRQADKARQAREILLRDYSTGGKDFEELLRIERMLLSFGLEKVKAVRDVHSAIVKMEMLYGK